MENITENDIKNTILRILCYHYPAGVDFLTFYSELSKQIPSEYLKGDTEERLLRTLELDGYYKYIDKFYATGYGYSFYTNKGGYRNQEIQQVINDNRNQGIIFNDKVEKTNIAHHSPDAQQKLEFVEQKEEPQKPKDKEIFGIPVKKLKIIVATIFLTGLLTAAGKKVMTYFSQPTKERRGKDSSKANDSIENTNPNKGKE